MKFAKMKQLWDNSGMDIRSLLMSKVVNNFYIFGISDSIMNVEDCFFWEFVEERTKIVEECYIIDLAFDFIKLLVIIRYTLSSLEGHHIELVIKNLFFCKLVMVIRDKSVTQLSSD